MAATKSKKKVWIAAGVAVLLLLLFRGCGDDDSSTKSDGATPTTRPTPTDVYKERRWVGTVADYDAGDTKNVIWIDLDGDRVQLSLDLVTGHGTCPTGANGPQPSPQALSTAIQRLAPPGTHVVVDRRGTDPGWEPTKYLTASLVYLPSGDGDEPEGVTLNEQLLRSGAAALSPNVDIGRATDPARSVEGAVAALSASPPPNVPKSLHPEYPAMVRAYADAWVNRVGETGVCARGDEVALAEREVRDRELQLQREAREQESQRQQAELEARVNGPDGVPNSGDEEYSSSTSGGSGGGGGGGGGLCRRSRWC